MAKLFKKTHDNVAQQHGVNRSNDGMNASVIHIDSSNSTTTIESCSGNGLDKEAAIGSAITQYISNRYHDNQRVAVVTNEHLVDIINLLISSCMQHGSQEALRVAANLAMLNGRTDVYHMLQSKLKRLKHEKIIKQGKWQILMDRAINRGLAQRIDFFGMMIQVEES